MCPHAFQFECNGQTGTVNHPSLYAAMEMGWRVGLRVLFLRVGERVVKRFGLRVGFDLLLPFESGSQNHGTVCFLLYTHRNNVSRASFRVCKVRPPVACVHPSSPPHVEPAKKDLIDET